MLVSSYRTCRKLNAKHGRTYYLATLLMPPAKRPFVHALYGFARYADEIVDDLAPTDVSLRAARLDQLHDDLFAGLSRGASGHQVLAAVIDTALRWQIRNDSFSAFLHSMQMDLTVTEYPTFDALHEYVYGSAAVIGLQMLPILEPTDPVTAARGAQDLGIAFQLANFIRDVDEDLDRGRIYLPLDELAAHGVTPAVLRTRTVDDRVRAALAEQVERVRRLSDQAQPTIAVLHPSVRDCIETARVLYCGIADEVERIDYQVFDRRATVPLRRRLAVAGRGWVAARQARHQAGVGTIPPAPHSVAH